MPQRVAALLPALNRARAVVLARVEQGPEQTEALLALEAPEAPDPALREVDHRLAQQSSRSSRCANYCLALLDFRCGT